MSIIDLLNGLGGECKTLSPRRRLEKPDIEHLRYMLMKYSAISNEITITYKPEMSRNFNESSLTDITKTILCSMSKRRHLCFLLVGEFSPTGMYHMHGIVHTLGGRDVNYIKRKLGHELGRTEVKPIVYQESYVNYVLKDTEFQREIYEDEVLNISRGVSHTWEKVDIPIMASEAGAKHPPQETKPQERAPPDLFLLGYNMREKKYASP